MAEERVRVLVVGGGAIGLSTALHLGRLGVDEVLLLERDRLTSGSSWHAAGIVGPLRASMNLTRLATYAIDLFAELEASTGQATGYRQTGGVWLAQRPERLQELRRIKAMGDRSGLHTEMLDAEAIGDRLPFIRSDDLCGGLWVDEDGQVNPVDLCMAYARAARRLGVEIRENVSVAAIETDHGTVSGVRLVDGSRIRCDRLVVCAGAWSRELLAGIDLPLPLGCCEHMYLVTDRVDGLADPCPIVRDLDSGIYLKGDAGKLVLGAFEANPKPWQPRLDDAGFLMFDEDWDHVQPMLEAGIHRAPSIAEQGIGHFMNGPESFTPDTRQLMGEVPGCRQLFVAAGFNSIGIMSSAGVGKVMADWVRDGEAPIDLWEVDVARLDPLQNDDAYLASRIPEAVHNQFAMHWPYKQFETGRDLRRSPWHDFLAQKGAVFGAPSGWERPLWYARDASETSLRYSYGEQHWWPMAQRETLHSMRAVSLFELSPFAKFALEGPDALSQLQRLACTDLDIPVGRVRYCLMLNRRGGIEIECTVARLAEHRFWLVGAAATRFRDWQYFQRHVAAEADIQLTDVTEDYAVAGIMGPDAPALLQALGGRDCSLAEFPFSSWQDLSIDDFEVRSMRLSFIGESGFELYLPSAQAASLLATIDRIGEAFDLDYAGHFAIEGCRLEMAYPHWGHDIGPEDTPFEAGLGAAVRLDKGVDFIGRDALVEQTRQGWCKRLRLCEVNARNLLILHDEPVYCGDEIVGHCSSGGPGFRTNKTLCFVMFYDYDPELVDACQIEIAGERFPLSVLTAAPYKSRFK